MSFETIQIFRAVPLKNNYLQLPSNQPTPRNLFYKTALSDAQSNPVLTGSELVTLGTDGNSNYLYGRQRVFNLPGVNAQAWYASNPVNALT